MTASKADTFNCPHCGKVFPILPSLVGRSVRCNKCRNPFRLSADGVAEKVDPDAMTKTISGAPPAKERAMRTTEAQDFSSQAATKTPAAGPAATKPGAEERAERERAKRIATEEKAARARAQLAKASEVAAKSREHESDLDSQLRDVTRTWMDSANKKEQQQKARPSSEIPPTKRMTRRIDAVRQSMSATLSTAAEAAAKTIKDDSNAALEPGQKVTSVKLSGEGVVEARRGLHWAMGCCAALAVCVLAFWLGTGAADYELALERYAAPAGGSVEARIGIMRHRAWLWSVDGVRQPMLLADVGSVSAGRIRRSNLVGLDRLTQEERLSALAELAIFVPEKRQQAVRDLVGADGGPENLDALYSALDEADIPYLSYRQVSELLGDLVLNDESIWVLAAILAGEPLPELPGDEGQAEGLDLRRRMLDGDLPIAMEVVMLTGHDGMRLNPQGTVLMVAEPVESYAALMLRFSGPGWDDRWRVIDCHSEGLGLRQPDPLSAAIRRASLYLADLRRKPTAVEGAADVLRDENGEPIGPASRPPPPSGYEAGLPGE